MYVTCLIHICDMTYSHVRPASSICVHAWFIRVTWLILLCDMTHQDECHELFTHVQRHGRMWDLPHSYMWHDLFTCETCLIHICDMTYSHVRPASFIYVTWLIHMWDLPTAKPMLYIGNPAATSPSPVFCLHINESWYIYEWVMSHVWMSHVTRMNEACHMYEWVMSRIWLSHVTCMSRVTYKSRTVFIKIMYSSCQRSIMAYTHLYLIARIKLYVSFAECRLFYRALLQKRPII